MSELQAVELETDAGDTTPAVLVSATLTELDEVFGATTSLGEVTVDGTTYTVTVTVAPV